MRGYGGTRIVCKPLMDALGVFSHPRTPAPPYLRLFFPFLEIYFLITPTQTEAIRKLTPATIIIVD